MIWLRALSFLVGVQIPAVILLPILLARGGHPDPSHIVVDAIGWVFALAGALGILWCDLESCAADSAQPRRTPRRTG
jgi:hypothetical protein